ncbi:transposase [Vibrio parahaemolyticus]|nr:transposase [Vibrio parahaemolyticus]KWU30636.1 transposase [Vibrio parahaemolyticus]OEA86424.1 transposase [Vibrio parahaemolyticus]OEB34113.1 transposase [Vibrio parahaemolyticus]
MTLNVSVIKLPPYSPELNPIRISMALVEATLFNQPIFY